MISLYKRLFATYLFIGVLCLIGGAVFLKNHPVGFFVYLITLIVILCITINILHNASKKKFKEEVLTHLENCRAGIFIEELTKLMGKKRGRQISSFYASLCATGYDVLGDYDALYASCQNIKLKSHMPLYHRRMFSYYLSRGELDFAKDALNALSALAAKEKIPAEKKVIVQFVEECKRAIQVRSGEYDEPLKYYREMLNSTEESTLVSRVSYAHAYGEALFRKGDKEAAKEPLTFASSRGGDTKYKRQADKLLAEIG